MTASRRLVVTEHAAAEIFALAGDEQQLAVRALETVRDNPTGPSSRPAPFPHRPGNTIAFFGPLVIVYKHGALDVEVLSVRRRIDTPET